MNLSTDKFVKFIEFINFNESYNGTYNTMNIVSDKVFDSTMFYLYDTNGDKLCDVTFGIGDLFESAVYLSKPTVRDTYEIHFHNRPNHKNIVEYDIPSSHELFIVDYSTEEGVFQSSLLYNFELHDPDIPKVLAISNKVCELPYNIYMSVPGKRVDNFCKAFDIQVDDK
ncbi:hypothetical protein ABV23_RS00840 [Escherichia coli]|nr:hypothetical protein [Escherichia coli]